MAEVALRARLIDTPAVYALVAERIYPKRLPQAPTLRLPAITYEVISNRDGLTNDGKTGTQRPRIQIDCWASTYIGASNLCEVVRTALQGKQWTTADGDQVLVVEHDSDRDGPDESDTDTEPSVPLERRISDYFVHYRKAG